MRKLPVFDILRGVPEPRRDWRGAEKEGGGMMRLWSVILAAATLACGCAATAPQETGPCEILFPYEWVGNIDRARFNEPSGIVFHAGRGTLFVVGDSGDICEIRTDGGLVKQKRIRRGDFEGVTYDPGSGLVYIAVEGEERILELNPDDFEVLREFTLPRTFEGHLLLKAGGQGIEGITFVPDAKHAEGGTFYVANQSFGLGIQDDISGILEVEVPLRSGTEGHEEARILRYFCPGVIDLSGLHYDKRTGHLFVISDSTNAIFEFTTAGGLVNSWAFPGDNQEGITADEQGFMYMAQDSGGVIKVKWNRE